jgi:NAD(P)-dependent dehydrogenase (short-subunit alcohol dehydrogenase family)
MKGLAGKTVLVTGGGGAIGSAICRRFAEAGAKLLVADRAKQSAEAVAAEVKGRALVFDIADYAAANKALGDTGVDILVNNAGWDRFQNFVDMQPEDWDALIAINLRGPAQHASPDRAADAGARAGPDRQHLLRRGARRLFGRSGLLGVQGRRHLLLENAGARGRPQGHHRQRRLPWSRPTRRSCAASSAKARRDRRSTTRWCAPFP